MVKIKPCIMPKRSFRLGSGHAPNCVDHVGSVGSFLRCLPPENRLVIASDLLLGYVHIGLPLQLAPELVTVVEHAAWIVGKMLSLWIEFRLVCEMQKFEELMQA